MRSMAQSSIFSRHPIRKVVGRNKSAMRGLQGVAHRVYKGACEQRHSECNSRHLLLADANSNSKHNSVLLTRIPSNLAATKVSPGSLMASAAIAAAAATAAAQHVM